jgi:hypothetical protein
MLDGVAVEGPVSNSARLLAIAERSQTTHAQAKRCDGQESNCESGCD